ncbi:MBL fold metallo-hydrolase [Amycolatopsis sp. NPDC098790]|uniref:MBL fold metallo-hydrolase n=1 Tax=Amycolatopsis sp. NPDC098790 TaxID=3363939 RepID=UPI0037F32CA8
MSGSDHARFAPTTHGFSVFTTPAKPAVVTREPPAGEPRASGPSTATLVYGPREAVLVDALATVAEATVLADWIELHGRTLTTIYITHGHFDHFYGLSVLAERFPEAKAVATPGSVELMRATVDNPKVVAALAARWPGRLPENLVVAAPYDEEVLPVDDMELRIIEQGRTDLDHSTSVHVPALDLVVAGDVVFTQCHLFLGDTTEGSRNTWLEALDRLAALAPAHVVGGHKKTGAPDLPVAIDENRRYIEDFSRLVASDRSDLEIFTIMGEKHPGWVGHQWWLMFNQDTPRAPASQSR